MPIYEYRCEGCGKHHEIMQKITDAPLTACPDCGGEMKKQISNTSFVLKGTGWYATDYGSDRKKSDTREPKDRSAKTADAAAGKKEGPKGAKTEKKSETKEAAVSK
jgi:putative FmdB family regulatory protein